ncbi:MAG: formate/nitrite transporter family protein [Thermoplasmata archaeon]|nr:formate/nitrite transporter family protein [Thermoplasmata archaeon]
MSEVLYRVDRTLEGIIEVAGPKFRASPGRLFWAAFMAGAFIAVGFLLALVASFSFHPSLGGNPSLFKLVLGAVFPMGLIAVVIGGADLWTGNVQFVCTLRLSGRAGVGDVLYNWIVSYGGNLAGSLFVAFLAVRLTGLISPGDLGNVVLAIARHKVSLDVEKLFFLGVGCNWLVNLAIWQQSRLQDGAGRILAIWFPIFAFVTIGFEHSIANMFVIGAAAMLPDSGIGYFDMMRNLVPVTLGNAVGGFLFVSLYYWYLSNPELGPGDVLREVAKFAADLGLFSLAALAPMVLFSLLGSLFPILSVAYFAAISPLLWRSVCPVERKNL